MLQSELQKKFTTKQLVKHKKIVSRILSGKKKTASFKYTALIKETNQSFNYVKKLLIQVLVIEDLLYI